MTEPTPSDSPRDDALPGSVHPGPVCLLVNDRDRILAFYRTVVGLSVLHRGADRATLGAGGRALLELTEDPTAPERTPDETGLFHVAFRVPSREALADALVRARESGRFTGASDHRVSEAIYLRDPEGNGVEVYRDFPREAWPVAADGTVDIDTLPLDLDALAALSSDSAELPPDTDVGHVHLEVSSLAAARDWFVDDLGMTLRDTYADSAVFLAAGDYHHHVGLNVWNRRTAPRAARGLVWFSLVVPDEATLTALGDRLGVDAPDPPGELRVDLPHPRGVLLRVFVADGE